MNSLVGQNNVRIRLAKLFAFLSIGVVIGIILLYFLLRTASAGENIWTTTGPYGIRVMGLAIDPENSQTIYATSPDGASSVYKSEDGGLTWLSSSIVIPDYANSAWNYSLVFKPENSDTLYIATERGVYKSIDAGQTWVQKSTIVEDDAENGVTLKK